MSSFKLGGMTFGSLFKKPETILYPYEVKEACVGLKGHIVNSIGGCILCGICQKACPCNCIKVDKNEREWAIDPFMCILCGSCVRVCPVDCLSMNPEHTPVTDAKYCKDFEIPETD